jgi:hypothetical protein
MIDYDLLLLVALLLNFIALMRIARSLERGVDGLRSHRHAIEDVKGAIDEHTAQML